jgi:hypothetical protein
MRSSIRRVLPVPLGIALGVFGIGTLPATAQAAAPRHDVVAAALPSTPAHTDRVHGHPGSVGANTPARITGRALFVTVTSCSEQELQAAIAAVATVGGTVNLRPRCVYTLTDATAPDNDDNALPVIKATVTVNGNGDTITRSAATEFRFFEIDAPNGNLALRNLTLRNGHASGTLGSGDGGAIFVTGKLSLFACAVTRNTADEFGGGIESDFGTVTASASTLGANAAQQGGGMRALGGSTTVSNSAITGNTVRTSAPLTLADGGGIDLEGGGTARIENTRITNNSATHTGSALSAGGGLFNASGTVTLTNSPLVANTAQGGTGAMLFGGGGGAANISGTMSLTNSPVVANRAIAGMNNVGLGGGLFNGGPLTVRNSPISNNTADGGDSIGSGRGGGIFNQGALTVTNSPLFSNTATAGSSGVGQGGAIYNQNSSTATATATLTNSPLTSNTARGGSGVGFGMGGGLYLETGTRATLTTSPLTNNTARGGTGGGFGFGGGLYLSQGATATLRTSPVTFNKALPPPSSAGGGIYNQGGTVNLVISPVVGNTPDQCAPPGSVPGCF